MKTSTKESVAKKADEAIEGLHEESQGDAQDALKHLRAIGRLILTNAEFRKVSTFRRIVLESVLTRLGVAFDGCWNGRHGRRCRCSCQGGCSGETQRRSA
jgi:hypothetical protein